MDKPALIASVFVALLLVGGAVTYVATEGPGPGLQSFGTRAAFNAYLDALREADRPAARGLDWAQESTLGGLTGGGDTLDAGDFSGTNVQVAGVDEADIAKTDGELIYLASGDEVVLLRAHPPDRMEVVSRIPGDALRSNDEVELQVVGLFLHEEVLVVLSGLYAAYDFPQIQPALEFRALPFESRTLVSLFSVADPSDPVRLEVYELTGSYQAARLQGGVLYLVLQEPVYVQEEASFPAFCVDDRCQPYDGNQVFYDPEAPEAGSLTNIAAIDLATGVVGTLSLLTGYASTIYMSRTSLFVTFAKWGRLGEALPPANLLVEETGYTSIYRIDVDGIDLSPASWGNVKGWLLNQFSMDEHLGYLR
ncbi:MAG: beta-propeller domain-containing protein, partial [Thermoplasmata archaeon]|nr:beta-propeller domain-containing protein [Thermoplasmata archaeon]